MEAHHTPQPYDVPSALAVRAGEDASLWTPAPDALLRASEASRHPTTNVHTIERLASGLIGGLLVARGMAARGTVNKLLAMLGSALVFRGVSGHCHLYQGLGIDTAHPRA
ncbi:MAG: DUF2892 domain-containing protein [Polyangiales bacterium]